MGAPNWGMIGRLKPPLDFYYAYRSWIVRYYPEHIKQPGSAAQCKTWTAMKSAIDGWNDLTHLDREAWTVLVRNAMRTGKDFYYRVRLSGATKTPYTWLPINLRAVDWYSSYVLLKTSYTPPHAFRAYYANQAEQQKAYYWKDEGFCIRGRRMSVKRNLIERWPSYVVLGFPCPIPYRCYRIPVDPYDTEIHVTFRLTPGSPARYHGRSGVYRLRRP